MQNQRMNKRIGLLTPYTGGNLGDAAIQDEVIRNIKIRCPSAEIYSFTLSPRNTEKRHNITSFPMTAFPISHDSDTPSPKNINTTQRKDREGVFIERIKAELRELPYIYPLLKSIFSVLGVIKKSFLVGFNEIRHAVKSYRILKGLDLLIVSGGGQLDENWGGAWGHPYTLFKWAIIARMARTKLLFLSVGMCALISRPGNFFIKWALKLADYRSYRDYNSKKLLENMHFTKDDPIFPDLAFSFSANGIKKPFSDKESRTIVGISPMAYCDPRVWPKKDLNIYETYIKKLANFVLWLVQKNYAVMFFPSQIDHDTPVIKDIIDLLRENEFLSSPGEIICNPVLTLNDLMLQISATDIVITSRLHGVILSYLLKKPAIAISYDKKVDVLMEDMGQTDYCLDIHDFDLGPLIDRFKLLESNRSIIERQIESRISHFRNSLEHQYDLVFYRCAAEL
jgi:polysaccharide pyruvyl transferase WcaK-like protein